MSSSARTARSCCHPNEAKINVYVDDPILLVAGLLHIRRRTAAKIFYIWLALGYAVARRKSQRGAEVTWTSARYVFGQSTVGVAIKEELIRCVPSDVAEFLSVKVISEKWLRTLAGRAVHVASLIFTWSC